VGWTDNVKGMLEILNSIFDPGTEVHLLNRCPVDERVQRLAEMGLDCGRDLYNLEVFAGFFIIYNFGGACVHELTSSFSVCKWRDS
jgi:hypothetical protein